MGDHIKPHHFKWSTWEKDTTLPQPFRPNHHHHHYTNVCKFGDFAKLSLLVFNKSLSNLTTLLTLRRSFLQFKRISANWSQSKVKKNRGKVYRIARSMHSPIMASEASLERTRERATKARSSHSRLLSWLLVTPPNKEFARRLSIARETLLTLTVLSTAPENILPLLNAKAATLPWWRKRVWTQVKLSRFHTYHRINQINLWLCFHALVLVI